LQRHWAAERVESNISWTANPFRGRKRRRRVKRHL
jgi:hypothetical protein